MSRKQALALLQFHPACIPWCIIARLHRLPASGYPHSPFSSYTFSSMRWFAAFSPIIRLLSRSRVLLQDSEVSSNTASGQGSVFNVVNAELVSFNNVTFAGNSGQCLHLRPHQRFPGIMPWHCLQRSCFLPSPGFSERSVADRSRFCCRCLADC